VVLKNNEKAEEAEVVVQGEIKKRKTRKKA
jgi:hypothetical protein